MECTYASRLYGPCRFPAPNEEHAFESEGKLYCAFHAPLLARRTRDGTLKSELNERELAAFNEEISDFLTSEREEIARDFRRMAPDTLARLQAIYPGRRLGRNELESEWGERLFQITVEFMIMPHNTVAGVIFPGPFKLEGRTLARTKFEQCEFHGDLTISKCEFIESISFDNSRFHCGLNINDCIARNRLSCNRVVVQGPVYMTNTKIFGTLSLKRSRFAAHFHCCCSGFSAGAAIGTTCPVVDLELDESIFSHVCCLKNRLFGQIWMDGTRFSRAPRFSGTSVQSATLFSAAIYPSGTFKDLSDFAILVNVASAAGDRTATDLFRARWFECLGDGPAASHFIQFLIYLYRVTSQYGTNPGRAAWSFAIFNALALGFYATLAEVAPQGLALQDVTVFAVRQVVHPFDAINRYGASGLNPTDPLNGSLLVSLIAALHSMGALALLALFLHTTYRAFRRD